MAIKSAWVNRWTKERECVDITGSRVLGTARGIMVEYINKDITSKISHPCAREICEAWHEFRGKLYENGGNLSKAKVFSNPCIRNRMGDMLGGGNICGAVRCEGIREDLTHVKVGEL